MKYDTAAYVKSDTINRNNFCSLQRFLGVLGTAILLASTTLLLTACGSIQNDYTKSSTSGANTGQQDPNGQPGAGGGGNGGSGATAPGATPGGGTVGDFKLTCEEARFIHYLNIYRRSQGLNALNVSKNGTLAGRWHAQDMIAKNYFDHTEPNGRSFSSRTASFGYSAWAENIAAGNDQASRTFCQWKTSPGHDANMLNASHRSTGIGNAWGGSYGSYWSSNFGYSTDVNDTLQEPLTSEASCAMPTQLPGC